MGFNETFRKSSLDEHLQMFDIWSQSNTRWLPSLRCKCRHEGDCYLRYSKLQMIWKYLCGTHSRHLLWALTHLTRCGSILNWYRIRGGGSGYPFLQGMLIFIGNLEPIIVFDELCCLNQTWLNIEIFLFVDLLEHFCCCTLRRPVVLIK